MRKYIFKNYLPLALAVALCAAIFMPALVHGQPVVGAQVDLRPRKVVSPEELEKYSACLEKIARASTYDQLGKKMFIGVVSTYEAYQQPASDSALACNAIVSSNDDRRFLSVPSNFSNAASLCDALSDAAISDTIVEVYYHESPSRRPIHIDSLDTIALHPAHVCTGIISIKNMMKKK